MSVGSRNVVGLYWSNDGSAVAPLDGARGAFGLRVEPSAILGNSHGSRRARWPLRLRQDQTEMATKKAKADERKGMKKMMDRKKMDKKHESMGMKKHEMKKKK